jgi:quinol-cytochrome oxidoreductase complex cytochrome b subunit
MTNKKSKWSYLTFWLKDRWSRVDLLDETLGANHRRNPAYHIGTYLYVALVVQIIVGAILAMYYIPTVENAYRSVMYITNDLKLMGFPIGYWLRGIHKFTAEAIIVLAMLRVFRFFFTADFKKPNELSWLMAIFFLLMTTLFGFSGYVLVIDQLGYWATTIGTTFPTVLDYFPVIGSLNIGSLIQFIARGGTVLNQNSFLRFYALHYAAPLLVFFGIELFYYFRKKRRINAPLVSVVVFFIIIFLLVKFMPMHAHGPATPDQPPDHILPDWYFLFVYYFLKIMDFVSGILFSAGILFFIALMPWIERNPYVQARKRPLWIALGVLGVALFATLSYRSAVITDTNIIKGDVPYIAGAYFLVIIIGTLFQRKVYINEAKKGRLVHQK